jgi:aspartate aminotransferase-like enzyme
MKQLRIPGPTPLPPESRKAAGRQMINHRSREFRELLQRLTIKFKKLFQTKNDVLFLTGSGTAGMEAAIANLFSPGDKVLVFSIGYFGDRFAEISKSYGLDVANIRLPDGKAVSPGIVREALKKFKQSKAVLITHNETSTGVTNDIAAIAPIVKRAKKLLVVDAISSLAAIPLKVDRWGIDVAIAASQKAVMAPPGIAIVSVSPDAWQACQSARLPRFYLDFIRAKEFAEKWQTPATPAISVLFALDAASDLILKRGLTETFRFHARLAKNLRKALKNSGFRILAAERDASNTVTAAMLPTHLEDKTEKFITMIKNRFGIELAEGQGALKGKIFRIAHMGNVSEREIKEVIRALRLTLKAVQQ